MGCSLILLLQNQIKDKECLYFFCFETKMEKKDQNPKSPSFSVFTLTFPQMQGSRPFFECVT